MTSSGEPVTAFRGPYFALSNFAPYPVTFEGISYPTSEHAFVAAKTTNRDQRMLIASKSTSDAKAFGRTLALRGDWDHIRDDVMLAILRDKFNRNPEAAAALLATDRRELIEGNTWHDNYWGECSCTTCRDTGVAGLNRLGATLMRVRDEIASATGPANRK